MTSLRQARRSIGGDFELGQLRGGTTEQLRVLTRGLPGRWVTSGRGALACVLKALREKGVRHVHLPAYLCRSLLLPVQALGFSYSFYPVDSHLVARPAPPPDSATVIIHYFGWLNPAARVLRESTDERVHLIEDACQALLSDWSGVPPDTSYVILSPRKFGPAPLGGWCNVAENVNDEAGATEIESLAWCSLAARAARARYLAEAGAPLVPALENFYLEDFKAVEDFLDRHPTYAYLPQFALELIAGIDWQEAASRRRDNWQHLHALLSDRVEALKHNLPEEVVPLGYAVRLPRRDAVRERLAAQRIFCPVHWLLPAEVDARRFPDAASLSETLLTLPLDQRYGAREMDRIAGALLASL